MTYLVIWLELQTIDDRIPSVFQPPKPSQSPRFPVTLVSTPSTSTIFDQPEVTLRPRPFQGYHSFGIRERI